MTELPVSEVVGAAIKITSQPAYPVGYAKRLAKIRVSAGSPQCVSNAAITGQTNHIKADFDVIRQRPIGPRLTAFVQISDISFEVAIVSRDVIPS